MLYDFKDKIAVIAGGSGALGQVAANEFSKAGATVHLPLRRLPDQLNPLFTYHTLDVLNENQVSAFFTEIGHIDILVSTVGGYHAGESVSELATSLLDSQLELNLKSAFLLTKYAVQAMSHTGGKIVLVSSRAAVDKGQNSFAYSVSKLGIVRLVEAVAAEMRSQNININAILPSLIDTPDNRQSMPQADYTDWPQPLQILKVIQFLCSDDAVLINGAVIPVYGKV